MEKEKMSLEDANMVDLIVKLVDTEYWPAIKRYNRMQDNNILHGFATIDPVKEPTSIARSQGMRMGLFQLEHDAEAEKQRREDLEKAQE